MPGRQPSSDLLLQRAPCSCVDELGGLLHRVRQGVTYDLALEYGALPDAFGLHDRGDRLAGPDDLGVERATGVEFSPVGGREDSSCVEVPGDRHVRLGGDDAPYDLAYGLGGVMILDEPYSCAVRFGLGPVVVGSRPSAPPADGSEEFVGAGDPLRDGLGFHLRDGRHDVREHSAEGGSGCRSSRRRNMRESHGSGCLSHTELVL
jgi:hypothetical protein